MYLKWCIQWGSSLHRLLLYLDKHNPKKKNLLLYKALHENNKYTRFTYLVWRFPFTLAHQSVTLLYGKFGTHASKRLFLSSSGSTKKGKRKEIRKELCEIIAGYFFIRVFLHSTYLQYTIWKSASVSSLASKDRCRCRIPSDDPRFLFLFLSFFSSERSLHWCNFPMLFQPKVRFFAISCHSIFGSVARTNFSVWSVQRSTATGGVCGNIWIFSAKWNHFILALIARTELEYPLYLSTMCCANTQLARQCRRSISVPRCCSMLLFVMNSRSVCISFVKENSNDVIWNRTNFMNKLLLLLLTLSWSVINVSFMNIFVLSRNG